MWSQTGLQTHNQNIQQDRPVACACSKQWEGDLFQCKTVTDISLAASHQLVTRHATGFDERLFTFFVLFFFGKYVHLLPHFMSLCCDKPVEALTKTDFAREECCQPSNR